MLHLGIRTFFTPPLFDDPELTRRARLFHGILVVSILLQTLMQLVQLILLSKNTLRWVLILSIFDITSLILLKINKMGKTALASTVFLVVILAQCIIPAWTAGGIASNGIRILPPLILLAGLLLGWKKGFFLAGILVILTLGFALAETAGILPANQVTHNPISIWFSLITVIIMLVCLTYFSIESLDRALQTSRTKFDESKRIDNERKKIEETLKESELRYKLLFEAIPESVLLIGPDRRVITANQASANLYGYGSPQELEGLDTRLMIAERDRDRASGTQTEIFKGKEQKARRYVGVRRDGSEFFGEVISTTIHGTHNEVTGYIGITRDITALIDADEEIKKYQLHLEEMISQRTAQISLLNQLVYVSLESASVGAWWIDFTEKEIYHALDTMAQMLEMPVSKESDKSYRLRDLIITMLKISRKVPEYKEIVDTSFERFYGTISGKYDNYSVVFPVVLADGNLRWIEARAYITRRDDDGKARVMTGTLIDVTKMVEAEKELKEHKIQLENLVAERTGELAERNRELSLTTERLRLATSAATIGIWDWDIVNNNLIWDDTMYGIYHMRQKDFENPYEPWRNVIHPDDKARVDTDIQQALSGKREFKPEYRIVWPDGSVRNIKSASRSFYSQEGKPLRMVGINYDITVRIQTETALRQSEAKLNEAQRIAQLGNWELELSDNRLTWSDEAYRIFEMDKERFGSTYEAFLNTVHPEDRETVHNAYIRSIETKEPYDIIHRVIMADGKIKFVKEQCEIVSDIGGKPLRAIGVVQDITKMKLAEENLVFALKEKETLIRELFHRTKNTMQIIRGMIVLQANQYSDNKELETVVKMTEDRIQAISLVHQMLYSSQNLSQISIAEYIRQLSALTFQSFGVKTDRISLNLQIEDQEVLLDTAIPFGLILNELLTNSLKHGFSENRSGEIGISLKTGNSKVNVLRYYDTGKGITEGFNFRDQTTLGLKLIYSIGEDLLLGIVEMDGKSGFTCSIEFPKNVYQARV